MTHPRAFEPVPASGGQRRIRSLVTGGAGFIGSHLVSTLLARGDEVTVVDNLSTGRRINLPESRERLTFIEGDLAATLGGVLQRSEFDEIFHLAAAVGVKLIVAEPIESIKTNIEQTSSLLEFAHGQRSVRPRVLIASSSEVYGKSTKDSFSEEDDVVYGPTSVPRWSYAMCKAIDEHLALAYHGQRGLAVTVTRFFNTVGPGQVGDYGMVLPRFVARAVRGEPIEIYGDGSQSRCFCDVRDVASVLPRVIGCAGGVFNIGSAEPVSIAELARLVIRSTGSSSEVRMIPYEAAYGAGFEDLRFRRPDVRKLRERVGFEPVYRLEQTIRDVAEWIRSGQRSGVCWTDDANSVVIS
jgi:UDP-glucose 4-epimerase